MPIFVGLHRSGVRRRFVPCYWSLAEALRVGCVCCSVGHQELCEGSNPLAKSYIYFCINYQFSQSERVCASPFHFDIHEQKILVGFAREVVPADTIQVSQPIFGF